MFSQGDVGLPGEPGECGFQGDKVSVCLMCSGGTTGHPEIIASVV